MPECWNLQLSRLRDAQVYRIRSDIYRFHIQLADPGFEPVRLLARMRAVNLRRCYGSARHMPAVAMLFAAGACALTGCGHAQTDSEPAEDSDGAILVAIEPPPTSPPTVLFGQHPALILSYEWHDAATGEMVSDYPGENMTVDDLPSAPYSPEVSVAIEDPAMPQIVTFRFFSRIEAGIPAYENGRWECSAERDQCVATASENNISITVSVPEDTRVMVADVMYAVPVDNPASPPPGDDFATYGVVFEGAALG